MPAQQMTPGPFRAGRRSESSDSFMQGFGHHGRWIQREIGFGNPQISRPNPQNPDNPAAQVILRLVTDGAVTKIGS